MKFFALPIISIVTAHIALSAAYTATLYLGQECALDGSVQPTFQVTAFNLSAGGSGCVAPAFGTGLTWGSLALVGCTSPGFTELFVDSACSEVTTVFNGNSVCETFQSFLSFRVTRC
ncbi:hypothetical protein BDZ97DRAFT_1807692 [Flammula alnicola]|nr:hypothetical protein BDZ97DRAFT_1807692 [Flammula alnicola]